MTRSTINLDQAGRGIHWDNVVRFAEEHGYKRSKTALEREGEEGSIGQYGLTVDEAVDFIRRNGLAE